MYARFFRWASDRLDINGDGIIAFVTNRSFIDRRTFDGFRKSVAEEFNEIWIIDLGGDVRANPRLSGTTHNVFGIQTGVAISFLVRRKGQKGCVIRYARRPEDELAEEKLAFLASSHLATMKFEEVQPDKRHSWINQASNDFETFLPIANKQTKATTNKRQERAIFKLHSLGVSTNRDEWLYAESKDALTRKVRHLIENYEESLTNGEPLNTLKWSRNLKRRWKKQLREPYDEARIVRANYRPFSFRFFYQSDLFVDELGSVERLFPHGHLNKAICFSDVGYRAAYCTLAVQGVADLHFGASVDAYQQVARFRYANGECIDNVTDWALNRFCDHYEKGKGRRDRPITKDAIFNYVYATLHDPVYRATYAFNLQREFPRIPFHPDFWQWADWGERLASLHIRYESVEPFGLMREDKPDDKASFAGLPPRPILKSNKQNGSIILDSETTLRGIPPIAWSYVLGNRSAIDWVLDQHKEKKPKDPLIREKFDTYRFVDHKDRIIDLLKRVTTVSVETTRIIEAMSVAYRNNRSCH